MGGLQASDCRSAVNKSTEESQRIAQPPLKRWARRAGLRIIEPEALVIRRRRSGRGFFYVDEAGRRISDPEVLSRIRSLAVPPAYEDVHIAPDADAHLQAIGRDDAGRLQYRYHPDWEGVRDLRKVERLGALCAALPNIRRKIARDLRRSGLGRDRVLAAVVTLIDRTHIRVGYEDYVHSGRSRGAATLLKRNVWCEGDAVHLTFRGKGGKAVTCEVRSAPLARTVRALKRLPGSRLFQYRDEEGAIRRVTAGDTNAYLNEVAGAPVTAKDFRTLAATAVAAERLAAVDPDARVTRRRSQLRTVLKDIAEMLGNTPAITRKSYVHPKLVEAFHEQTLRPLAARCRRGRDLSTGEAVVAALFGDGGKTGRRNRS